MSHPPGLLTPVTSLAEAERACANGADILDVGQDAALAVAVRGALPGVLVAGQVDGADYALRDGTVVDVDTTAGPSGAAALAAVWAWRGADIIRTSYVREVRRSLDMTASIMGIRPPIWAVRGLG